MSRSDNRAALTDEIARFQAEVRRLALATVRAVIAAELDRRQHQRKAEPARKTEGARKQKAGRAARAAASTPAPAAAPSATPATAAATENTDAAANGGKRAAWTRDSVIKELATLIVSGMAIDAPFVTRHGPPGLVAATRRIFGRFDAALNVASLHIAKLYPEGPPNQRPGSGRATRVALPRARKAAAAAASAAPAESAAAAAQSDGDATSDATNASA